MRTRPPSPYPPMCDFCGCPQVEPFASLTDEHQILTMLADAYFGSRDALDLDAIRVAWEDHRTWEWVALEPLAQALGLSDALGLAARVDPSVETLLAEDAPDPDRLRGAIVGHADAYEYEVFPQLMMGADEDEIADAARRGMGARPG